MLTYFLIIVLPLMLVATGIVAHRWRWYLMGLVVGAVGVVSIIHRVSLYDIGIRLDNVLPAAVAYGLFSAVGYAFIRWYGSLTHTARIVNWKRDTHFRYAFVPISIAQQFVFMSYSLVQLVAFGLFPWLAIVLNTAIFALAHAGYGKWKTHLPVLVLAGIGFSALYYYFPNLIIASIAHMALNVTAVYYGFFAGRPANSGS